MRRISARIGGLLLALLLAGCQTDQRGVRINLTQALRYYRQHADRRPTREQMQQVLAQLPAEQLNDLGVMHEREGRLEEAVWAYQHAIWQSPRFSRAYVNLGNLLRQRGKVEEARFRYLQALNADASNVVAANNLGDLAAESHTGVEEALARLTPLVAESGPYRAYELDTLGRLYLCRGEGQPAYDALTAALRESAADPSLQRAVYTHLAEACRACGKEAEAREQEAAAARLQAP